MVNCKGLLKQYKSICKGVYDEAFSVRKNISVMEIGSLRHERVLVKKWIEKTGKCHDLRMVYKKQCVQKSDHGHDHAIKQAKFYEKKLIDYKKSIDTQLKIEAKKIAGKSNSNSNNSWTSV